MNLWNMLTTGADKINGLLYPGMAATGVDPQLAQAARAQAMMQMGAGLLGGQNVGQAYGVGQAAGYEPIEQARRQQVMQADAQWREMQTAEMKRQQKAREDAAAYQSRLQAELAPYIAKGDYEGAKRRAAELGAYSDAKDIAGLAPQQKAPGTLYKVQGPQGAQYATAEQAVGMTPYKEPVQGPAGSWSQPFEAVDPKTGQPGLFQSHSLTGQIRPAMGGLTPTKNRNTASPAQAAVDRKFATDYVEFVTGGAADMQKSREELAAAKARIDAAAQPGAKENLTGPGIGMTPDSVLSVVDPAAIDVRDTVANTVQRTLRTILGAQFTQKEGENLIARAYNTKLDEKDNSVRVGRLLTQIDRALKAKQEAAAYFEQNGTLEGYKGKTSWSVNDFNPDATDSGAASGAAPKKIMGDADYAKLPSGALFIGPDGKTRRKP